MKYMRVHKGERYTLRHMESIEIPKGFYRSLRGLWWGTQNYDVSKSWLTYHDSQNSTCFIHINFKGISSKCILIVSIEVIDFFA